MNPLGNDNFFLLDLTFKVDLDFTSDPDLIHGMALIHINDVISLHCLENQHFKCQNCQYNKLMALQIYKCTINLNKTL